MFGCGGKRHGQGKHFYSNTETYNGSWKEDLRDGFGMY
jgi:hypothetical protein